MASILTRSAWKITPALPMSIKVLVPDKKLTGKLVQTVDEMRQDICQHDAQAKEILKAVNGIAQKPAPRPRKSGSKA